MSVESRFVEFDGKKTQLTVAGEGPPLLYLHSALGETEWQPYLDAIAEHFTVYLPAHPGFALTSGLDTIRETIDMAWHYIDLLAALELDRVHMIGLSIGGWIGLEVALMRPELVDHIILVGSAGIRIPEVPIGEIFVDNFEEIRQLTFADPKSEAAYEVFPEVPTERHLLTWLRAREATARVGWNPYLHNPRLAQHLHRIESPTLVLWGQEDRLMPIEYAIRFADYLPNSKLVTVPNCGHLVPMEKPAEFTREVLQFLS